MATKPKSIDKPTRKDGESREKIYDHSYKDNPLFLQFSENLSGLNYNKGGASPRGKVMNKMSQKKKAVKVVRVGENDLSSRDLFDCNREFSFEEKPRRGPFNVPGFENQHWSLPRTDQKGTFHSQIQVDVDDRSKNHKSEQQISSSVAQIQRSQSTSRSVGTFMDKVASKVISNKLERRQSKKNPRSDWRQAQERNSVASSNKKCISKDYESEEKGCIVTSQEGYYLQQDRSFNNNSHQKQAFASFDSSMISQRHLMGRRRVTFPCTEHFDPPVQVTSQEHTDLQQDRSFNDNQTQALASFDSPMISQGHLMGRRRVTFPCTEHFDPPVQEILTYSHTYISDKKSFIPMLGPPAEEFTNFCLSECHAHADKQQEVDSIVDRTLGIPNMIETHRVSEFNDGEPNLPSKSHLNTTRRDGNQVSICIQEGVMNSQFNTLRSLEENKRWKAYRSSQNNSHPIIWSSGGRSRNAQWSKTIK